MQDNCKNNCKYFGFADPKPPNGYGSNWYCFKHRKPIKNADGICKKHKDKFKKVYKEKAALRAAEVDTDSES